MPRCPVCQTKYVAGKTDNCLLCGWNLLPYSLIVGVMPEVFLKEQSRLEWARSMWAKLTPHREQIQQLQLKLKDAEGNLTRLNFELEKANEQHKQLATTFQQRESELTHLQKDSERVNQELIHLRGQLEQANQAREQLLAALHQRESNQLYLQEQSERATKDLIYLREELKQANQARDQLSTTLHQQEITIAHIQSQVNQIALVQHQTITDVELKPGEPSIVLPSNQENVAIHVESVDTQKQKSDFYIDKADDFQENLGNNQVLEMVGLPGGSFWMGSKETEEGRESHEEPLHQVKIQPFYMSRFPITQSQWEVIANLPSIHRSLNPDPSNIKGQNLPVEQVSWYDAVEFSARLTKLTGRNYRLPSEAEWEYACRAGTTTPFHFGETITPDLANYDGNYIYGSGIEGKYNQKTVAVGSFKVANAFGLCDMHGNIWEWCSDTWHDNYRDAPTDGRVWEEGGIPNRRILRGGSWYCLPSLCRSAQRHWDQANHGGSGIGFRVALSGE
jgi:formylglycine-generating enzyme required for sulfatase activity